MSSPIPPVILVFGSPRSGTTWLGKIFDSHPDTLYRHEPDSVLPSRDIPLYIPSAETEHYREPLREYVGRILRVRSPKVSGKLPLFPKSYHGVVARRARGLAVVAAKAGERVLGRIEIPDFVDPDSRPDVRVVWKSIESSGRLGALARVLDDCRVIHIVRHPCGTLASVLRGQGIGGFESDSPASEDYGIIEMLLDTEPARARGLTLGAMRRMTPVERMALIWALDNEKVMTELDGLDHCVTVRYEDLCERPEAVSRRLFDFCGLSWNPQTESFLRSSTAKNDPRFHSVFKDPRESANKWRRQLSPEDVRSVLNTVGDTRPGRLFVEVEP